MGTMTLNQYQQFFWQAVTRQEHEAPDKRLRAAIAPAKDLSALDALEVYRRGYVVRLTEALGETFEAVWWVSGDEDFFRLAKMFILTYPSRTYNLSSYGEEFAKFLEKERPFPDLPFIPDLARFEWLFKNIFHTGQHESVPEETIQSQAQQGNIRILFGPSVQLFTSPYKVYDIWKLRGTQHEKQPITEWDQSQYLLLYKKRDQIFVNELQEIEYCLLQQLIAKRSLEETLTATMIQFPDMTPTQISQLFQVMVHTGIIRHIEGSE